MDKPPAPPSSHRNSARRWLWILILLNILVACFTFDDYGFAWDEPLFYAYGDAVDYAYSVSARLSGDFDLERAYGPSATDHKYYGPAYLLLGRPLVDALRTLPVQGIHRDEWWHLINFLTFQIGVIGFYVLAQRWMSSWAALGTTALFATQPVLWGHGFINPKDMPFMAFFILTLNVGLIWVDRLMAASPPPPEETPLDTGLPQRRLTPWHLGVMTLAVCLTLSYLLTGWIYSGLRDVIAAAYHAEPGTLLGRLFLAVAARAPETPLAAYVNKAWALFLRLRSMLTVLVSPLLVHTLLSLAWPAGMQRLKAVLHVRLMPRPRWPQWRASTLSPAERRQLALWLGLGAVLLGLLTSIRVLGPLAGALVALYFLLQPHPRSWKPLLIYALIAAGVTYLTWPFLWDNPVARLIEVARHMANNPHILPVLFNGQVYPSNQLPRSYLPTLLGLTLTEPVWPLVILGIGVSGVRFWQHRLEWRSFSLI
ncbi:MAG: hypothetical protein N3A60_10130, partial [Thermanaerothrix sp.]|nr:hypothetical protein [Thermanaerothrix sp.]